MKLANPSKQWQRIKLHKREQDERSERLRRHHEKIDMLRAMAAEYEELGSIAEVRNLHIRIRNIEQQIRYIGGDI